MRSVKINLREKTCTLHKTKCQNLVQRDRDSLSQYFGQGLLAWKNK